MTDPAIPPKVDDGFSPTTISPLLKGLNWDLNDAKIQTRLFDELLKLGISDPYNFSGFVREYRFDLAHKYCPYCGYLQNTKTKSFKAYWRIKGYGHTPTEGLPIMFYGKTHCR